ncbi:MAG TPA: GNAT family N-acetyltransferase, partial [Verrucomicrobiales bacterium]|nr:GNAT family N-acetyltransferase [Verrucomicrobiales bacterium]
GKLVMGARTGYKDQYGRCVTMPMPGYAAALCGVTVEEYSLPRPEEQAALLWDGASYAATGFQETLKANGSQVLARYDSGWLKGEAKRSDFHFEKLSREGLLFRSLLQSVGSRGETLKFEEVRSFIQTVALKGGFEGFLVAQSRESQQDLREVMIRLEREAPAARVVKLRDFQVRVDDLANAAAFHIEHFRKRGVSPFLDQRLFHFLGEIAKDPDVGFQLSCLTNQGDILAVDFGFLRAGRYYSYLAASDETFARLEPGKCLLVKRINSWSKVDGVHALEFPVGDDGYPEGLFADSVCEVRSIRLMPRDLRNRARHLRLESNQQVRRFARSALEKTAILPR